MGQVSAGPRPQSGFLQQTPWVGVRRDHLRVCRDVRAWPEQGSDTESLARWQVTGWNGSGPLGSCSESRPRGWDRLPSLAWGRPLPVLGPLSFLPEPGLPSQTPN